jgi:tetratricopeptide (TPR) repeat protein
MEGKFEDALCVIEEVVAGVRLFAWLVPYWHGKCLFAVGRYSEATPALLVAFRLRGLRHDLMLSISESLYMQGRFLSSSFFHCLEALTLWAVNKRRSGRLLAEAIVHAGVFVLTRASRLILPLTRHITPLRKFQYSHFPPFEPEATLSEMAYEKGHMVAGHELIDRAIAVAPDVPRLWANKAIFLTHEKRYDEAIAACDRALLAEPDHPMWKHNREQLDLLKQGTIAETRRCLVDVGKKHDGSYSIENFTRLDRPAEDGPGRKSKGSRTKASRRRRERRA